MIPVVNRSLPLLLVVLVVLAGLGAASAADLGVSPPRLEVVVQPGQTVTVPVVVLTEAAVEQQIQIDIGDWEIGPEGSVVLLPPGSLAASASPWLEPEATAFVLEPRSQREFRLAVTVPADGSADGTHQTMVFFTVVPPPSDNPGVGVVTTTRIGVAVYVTVAGTERPAAELLDFYQRDEASVSLVVANDGNTVLRLGGGVELRDESGSVATVLAVPDVPVLRESERELTLPLPAELPSGFYVALALVEDSRGGLHVGELPLEIP